VGDDQRQHVEITRDIAERFNSRFGETFVVPRAVMPSAGARVMDLQNPRAKMSKTAGTEAGLVQLLDDSEMIARKFRRAVTDSGTEVRYDPETKPGVSNLLEILGAATGQPPANVAKGYTQYGPLKKDAGDAVIELLMPIQARYRELVADPGELAALLHKGASKARAVASVTLDRAYRAIGLLPH
jgi:tryptophanyl-tRNA synthetase